MESSAVFGTLEGAVNSFTKTDINLDFVVHDLNPGDIIDPDSHPVNEWVVAYNGRFDIQIGKKEYKYNARQQKGFTVFYIPRRTSHSLRAHTQTKYYVFKEIP